MSNQINSGHFKSKGMKIEIKNRWTGNVIFSFECNTIMDCLIEAIRTGANLRDTDLRGANLTGANLRGANLTDADLTGADLRDADLRDADLMGANLTGADLRGADLMGANLTDADLRGANLMGADLRGADLRGAYFTGAYLNGIKIKKTIVITGLYDYITMPIIAEDGKHWVKLGCHLRTVEDWEKDFWNNNNEFPNDNSVKSQLRVLAFETAKKWLEINKD